MSTVSKWVMALIIASIILAMLRRPAATVGIITAGGGVGTELLGTLSGGNVTPQKGSFAIGQNKVSLG